MQAKLLFARTTHRSTTKQKGTSPAPEAFVTRRSQRRRTVMATSAFAVHAPLVAPAGNLDALRCGPRRGAALQRATTRRASMSASTQQRETMARATSRVERIVLYDGVCGLCNRAVQWLLRADQAGKLKFAALQSDAGRALLAETGAPDDMSTMVFVDQGTAYTHSDAVLRIGEHLPSFSAAALFARLMVPRPIRDAFYTHVVANNRYWLFGQSDSCMLRQRGHEDRFLE